MVEDALLARAQDLWQELASVPVPFTAAGGVGVGVSPESRICPPGWVGIVVLGGAAVVTAPDEETAVRIRQAVLGLSAAELTDPEAVGKALPIGQVLGPASLAYVAADSFRPTTLAELRMESELHAEELPARHPDLDALAQSAGEEDAGEAALAEITSPAFVLRADGRVVAAAGCREWPCSTAHVSVLTSPAWRGKGLARVTGSAVVRYALERDLLPQWRARAHASRKAAIALGFRELGSQLSIRTA